MTLQETVLGQFTTSAITDKEPEVGAIELISASKRSDTLDLIFSVDSLSDDGSKHVDLRGNSLAYLKRGYSVALKFLKASRYLDQLKGNKQTDSQLIQQVINSCDVKVQCDCPAYYWQGMQEGNGESSYFNFLGKHGTGVWNARHSAAGAVIGAQACKHIAAVAEQISTFVPQILTKLQSSGLFDQVLKSSASQGAQQSLQQSE